VPGVGKVIEGKEKEVVSLIMESEEATSSWIIDDIGLENCKDDNEKVDGKAVDLVS